MRWLILSLLVCFLSVYQIKAASPTIVINSTSNPLVINQPFTVSASASGLLAGNFYHAKIRLGTSDSLNKGQTYNPQNFVPDDWLSDTDAWIKFPQIVADESGSWAGSITGRARDTAQIGPNLLRFSLRKVGDDTSHSSTDFSISLDPAPTLTPSPVIPTPTPTSTPTPKPTSTPSATSTPKPTLTPAPSASPTKAPTATPKPSAAPSASPTVGLTSESASGQPSPTLILVLGEDTSITPSPTPAVTTSPPALAIVLIGLGLLASASSIFMYIFHRKTLSP